MWCKQVRWRFIAAWVLLAVGVVDAQPPRGQRPRPGASPEGTEPNTPVVRPRGLQPRAFAITEARVVTEPGKVLDKATVVIRDGLIEAVGPDVAVPPDALRIDGKGLTAY